MTVQNPAERSFEEPQPNAPPAGPDPFQTPMLPLNDSGRPPSQGVKELNRRLVETHHEIVRLDARLKQEKASYAQIEAILREEFARLGSRNMKLETGETVYIQKSTYVSLVKDPDGSLLPAHQALRDSGLGYMVEDKTSASTLSAWFREQQKQGQEIPENLLPFLKIADIFHVKVRA